MPLKGRGSKRRIIASVLALYVATAFNGMAAWAEEDSLDELLNATSPQATPDVTSPETSVGVATPASAPAPATSEAATETKPAPATATSAASSDAPLEVIPVKLPATPVAKADNSGPHLNRQIEEVVVTATKREENLREIPASISAFQGEDLGKQGKINLEDYIQETPGVVINSQGPGAGARVTVRGIATEANPTSPRPSPVGIFIGDSAFSDPYIAGLSPDLSAFDLASVQVLKGPQGTLFGGAALAGAIRYVLNDPVLDEWQGAGFTQYIKADAGGSALTSGAMLNLPWTGHDVALRLGYVKRNYPGTIDDTRSGQNDVNKGGGDQKRALLLWKPLDALSLKLTHLDQNFSGANQIAGVDNPHGPRETDQFIIPQPAHNRFSLDSFEGDYDFDSMRVVSLSSYNTKEQDVLSDYTPLLAGDPPAIYPSTLAFVSASSSDSHAFSQELRLQSTGDGNFKWLVGGYFFDYTLDLEGYIGPIITQDLIGQGTPLSQITRYLGTGISDPVNQTSLLYATNHAKSQEKALFFDLTETLWDNLELSGGARFYKTFVDGGFVGTGVLARVANDGMDVDQRNRIDEHGISPRASITYHFNDDLMIYTSASRGFRFGGLQSVPSSPTNGVPATYKSDSLWNYEIGTRTSWFDNSLHVDLTAFYINYQNPQVTQKTQGTNLNYVTNVGAAVSHGAEASLMWLPPIPGLAVSLGGGITNAYTTVPFNTSSNTTISAGTQLPGSVKSQYSASVKQILPIGMFLIDASVDYTYVGKGYSDLQHDLAVNDFGTLSAGLGFGSESLLLRPRLSLNVANILNVATPVAGTVNAKALDQINTYSLYALNPPRTYSLRLSLTF